MGMIVIIILAVVYYYATESIKDKAVDNYDISKVDTLKMTMDMDKPLYVRKQNLIAGKYDKD